MSVTFKRLPINEKGELIKGEYALKSPRQMIFISPKKTGKTLAASNQPKILILDCESGTHDFGFHVSNKVDVTKYTGSEEYIKVPKYGYLPAGLVQVVQELTVANRMDRYWELFQTFDENPTKENYDALLKHINEMPFPIVMVDTITTYIELSNGAALYEYNQSVKAENRKSNIKKADDYGGVRYIRSKFDEVKRFVEQNAAPFLIYSGHVAEKKKVIKKDPEDLNTVDIALEGILSNTFTVRSAAIGIFYRNGEGCFIDFGKKDESDTGTRSAHLSNKTVKISDYISAEELEKGHVPKTYWQTFYPEIQFS